LFSRGDKAAGGAGDESPLIINETSLRVQATHHFTFNAGGRGGRGRGTTTGPMKVFQNVAAVNPNPNPESVIIWKNAAISIRRGGRGGPAGQQPTAPAAAQ